MSTTSRAEIVAAEELAARLQDLRQRLRLRVALANGCFDLLHVGHLRYLRAAAAEADVLVVGLNGDATVRQLKGRGRPLLPADVRSRLVAAVDAVDYVTVFEEPTADRLIELLRPDVHCKGTDYADGVPEAGTVRRVGGRVAVVGGPKDHDTTDLLRRIRALER